MSGGTISGKILGWTRGYLLSHGCEVGVRLKGRAACVAVAPVLQPFHFEENLQAGDRAGVTCLVTKGDPPITFAWEKDGRPVAEVGDVSVSSLNHFSSALMIGRLAAQHTGRYTCRASNHWAQVHHSADLAVNGTPDAMQLPPPSSSNTAAITTNSNITNNYNNRFPPASSFPFFSLTGRVDV